MVFADLHFRNLDDGPAEALNEVCEKFPRKRENLSLVIKVHYCRHVIKVIEDNCFKSIEYWTY